MMKSGLATRVCWINSSIREGLLLAQPLVTPFNVFSSLIPAKLITVFGEIGRAHVCTPVTNAHLVCRLLLEQKQRKTSGYISTSRLHTHEDTTNRHTSTPKETTPPPE